jgi:hypothetical protein
MPLLFQQENEMKEDKRGVIMTSLFRNKKIIGGSFIVMVFFIFMTGCLSLNSGSTSAAKLARDKGKMPTYHDFSDVLIPPGYKVDKKSTFVFQTPGFSAGVMVFRGKIKLDSLVRFFNKNMSDDNWRLISSFKSPRTLLIYNKENRWCVINISISDSKVEVWLAPTMGDLGRKSNGKNQSRDVNDPGDLSPLDDSDSGLFK